MENHCISSCFGKNHLLLIEDTTELNMERHRNRIASKSGEYEISINSDNKKRTPRTAKLEVKYGTVELCRPRSIVEAGKYPKTLSVQVVHVKERASNVPKGETPVEWILYTSHAVNNFEDAQEIIRYYALRWLIEDLFRTVKTKGLNYESSELETGKSLRKLLVMTLMAAVQILQLRQARDGKTQQKSSLVFSEEQLACMDDMLPHFEGKTEHLKNTLAHVTILHGRRGS
jgi:hypothetical protein